MTYFWHKIEWSNPYTQPPGGAPRVLAEVLSDSSATPPALQEFRWTLGGGYCHSVQVLPVPVRRMSQERLARMRRARLDRRMRKRYGMFADQFIHEEIERRPWYYEGLPDPTREPARQAVLAEEERRLQFLLAHFKQIIVHGQEPPECRARAEALRAERLARARKESKNAQDASLARS